MRALNSPSGSGGCCLVAQNLGQKQPSYRVFLSTLTDTITQMYSKKRQVSWSQGIKNPTELILLISATKGLMTHSEIQVITPLPLTVPQWCCMENEFPTFTLVWGDSVWATWLSLHSSSCHSCLHLSHSSLPSAP